MANKKEVKKASQGWLMTFTDMLMLLVVMFVLFLSFSEIDSDSFRRNAGPIAEAFNQPPPTSILPGQSAIIPMSTTNVDAETLGAGVGLKLQAVDEVGSKTVDPKQEKTIDPKQEKTSDQKQEKTSDQKEGQYSDLREVRSGKLSRNLETVMKDEIRDGKFEVVTKKNIVTLRFPEKVTFSSGEANLVQDIQPILDRIAAIISNTTAQDKIVITGHTDSVPISNFRFRSNWDLSAARAVSVVHHILKNKYIDKKRVLAVGSADANPLASNDNSTNRALNRRVEIRIELSDSHVQ